MAYRLILKSQFVSNAGRLENGLGLETNSMGTGTILVTQHFGIDKT
jgi:hypothetical protein